MPYPFDKIDFFHHSRQGIFEKAAPLYKKGMSLRGIAGELGVSKTNIRKTLIENGVDLRESTHVRTHSSKKTSAPHLGVVPYGYYRHLGQLFEDSKEQMVVQSILELKAKGLAYNAIAGRLNDQKIRPRHSKKWDHSTIRSIIHRHDKTKPKHKE